MLLPLWLSDDLSLPLRLQTSPGIAPTCGFRQASFSHFGPLSLISACILPPTSLPVTSQQHCGCQARVVSSPCLVILDLLQHLMVLIFSLQETLSHPCSQLLYGSLCPFQLWVVRMLSLCLTYLCHRYSLLPLLFSWDFFHCCLFLKNLELPFLGFIYRDYSSYLKFNISENNPTFSTTPSFPQLVNLFLRAQDWTSGWSQPSSYTIPLQAVVCCGLLVWFLHCPLILFSPFL